MVSGREDIPEDARDEQPIDSPGRNAPLLGELTRHTQRGRLEWETGSAATEFVLVQPQGSVSIQSMDKDGTHPVEVRILDPAGAVGESISSFDDETARGWRRY